MSTTRPVKHTLVPAFKVLCEKAGTGIAQFGGAGSKLAADLALDVLKRISVLPEDAWASLPYEAQAWYDRAAEYINNKGNILALIYDVSTPYATAAPGDKAISHAEAIELGSSGAGKKPTRTLKISGRRANPAMTYARNYVIVHPEVSSKQLLEELLKQKFERLPTRGSLDAVLFEMRSAVKLLKQHGMLKEATSK